MAELSTIQKNIITFWVPEVTIGTPVFPAATDAIFVNTVNFPEQLATFIEDMQKRTGTYSRYSRHRGRYHPGSVEFVFYIKPSGALGVAPHGKQALKGWYGVETVTGGVKVEYTPLGPLTATWPHFTIWYGIGNTLYIMEGCHVKGGSIQCIADDSDEAPMTMHARVVFMRLRTIGTGTVGAIEAVGQTVITLTANHAKKFATGTITGSQTFSGLVQFRNPTTGVVNNNAGAGYKVISVNYTADEITLDGATPIAGTALAVNDIFEPFLPTPTDVGNVVHGGYGLLQDGTAGTTNKIIISATVDRENPLKFVDNEKNDSIYAAQRFVGIGRRDVTLEMQLIQTEEETDYRYQAEAQTSHIVKLPWGNVAGARARWEGAKVQMDSPAFSGDEEIIITRANVGYGSGAGENEDKLVFD
ncbi:hypothetical protein L0152_07230 [bacterium]|nr:hypothetical protein [bacterium]